MSSDEALLGEGLASQGYELKRPRRDTWGSVLYGLFVAAAVVGGVFACYQRYWSRQQQQKWGLIRGPMPHILT